jgi:drug/metabolite transporter (DMT)-like permease
LFTALLAKILLGEEYTLKHIAASVVSLTGVVMVAQPTYLLSLLSNQKSQQPSTPSSAAPVSHLLSILGCLLSAIMTSVAVITVRKIGKQVHFFVFVVYFGFYTTVLGILGTGIFEKFYLPRTFLEWASMVLIAVFSFAGQTFMNHGIQLAPAGQATLMRNLDVVCALLYGVFIFGEVPTVWSGVGTFMILFCVLGLAMSKFIEERRSNPEYQKV